MGCKGSSANRVGAELMVAVHQGNLEIVRRLLENTPRAELNVNVSHDYSLGSRRSRRVARKIKGRKAVHVAAFGGHLEVVKLLQAHGARINAKCAENGRTALHWAAAGGAQSFEV